MFNATGRSRVGPLARRLESLECLFIGTEENWSGLDAFADRARDDGELAAPRHQVKTS